MPPAARTGHAVPCSTPLAPATLAMPAPCAPCPVLQFVNHTRIAKLEARHRDATFAIAALQEIAEAAGQLQSQDAQAAKVCTAVCGAAA